jgi:hypothetical protein
MLVESYEALSTEKCERSGSINARFLPSQNFLGIARSATRNAFGGERGVTSFGTRMAPLVRRTSQTMLRLKPRQRAVLVEKVPDLANIGAGVLVFGQFVTEPTSVWLALGGVVLWAILIGLTLLVAGANHGQRADTSWRHLPGGIGHRAP